MDKGEKAIYEVLNKVFGYSEFRSDQKQIIQDVIEGHDVRVIMPTGGGKSLCFQIPAIVQSGKLAVVISPLIALMEDQVIALRELDVSAACIHSGIDAKEKQQVFEQLTEHKLNMLYMAPESFLNDRFIRFVKTLEISMFAIDEAHCISVWGNDFRPEYTRLSLLKREFPQVPLIALTATADEATRHDISQRLGISDGKEYISSFERSNITINAVPGLDRINQIYRFLLKYKNESGIIYCLSRKNTELVASKLNANGYKAAYYHAGMDSLSRSRIQKRFQNDEINIVCATIAFGMGIDKSNVRFVIHYNLPKNIEGFYQEIGRAGRDGLTSESLLFYSWADQTLLRSFVDDGGGDETFKEVQRAKLNRMWEFANASTCRTNMILSYFGEYKNEPCGHCDNCLSPPKVFDGTRHTQMALSAMARCSQRLNINLLMDVLKGNAKAEIRQNDWDQVKTFGAGRDVPYTHWKSFIIQMVNQGLIAIDYTAQSQLRLTPLSKEVLSGAKTVELVEYKTPSKTVAKAKSKTAIVQDELFESLRKWRVQKAKQINAPAYVIFNDATLKAISEQKPLIGEDLMMIDGIGQVKIQRYGEEIIDVIQNYVRNQNHTNRIKGSTHLKTLDLYNEGLSVEMIALQRKLNTVTVYSHLGALYEKGETIDLSKYATQAELDTVGQKWKELNEPTELKVVHDALKGELDYYKIRLGISYQKRADKVKNG